MTPRADGPDLLAVYRVMLEHDVDAIPDLEFVPDILVADDQVPQQR
jgi:predicted ester cyclase